MTGSVDDLGSRMPTAVWFTEGHWMSLLRMSPLPHLWVRVPRTVLKRELGAGEVVKRLMAFIGVPACGPCEERALALDRHLTLFPSSRSGPPAPKPGCWFAGANCYGFIQTLKFCCGDGGEYTERWGWCIGYFRAPPCV